MYGFSEALLRGPEEGAKGRRTGATSVHPLIKGAPWINTGISTTWRNAVSEGAKRSLSGQEALQEWLMLSSPEPMANPWLSNLGSYRY